MKDDAVIKDNEAVYLLNEQTYLHLFSGIAVVFPECRVDPPTEIVRIERVEGFRHQQDGLIPQPLVPLPVRPTAS